MTAVSFSTVSGTLVRSGPRRQLWPWCSIPPIMGRLVVVPGASQEVYDRSTGMTCRSRDSRAFYREFVGLELPPRSGSRSRYHSLSVSTRNDDGDGEDFGKGLAANAQMPAFSTSCRMLKPLT